MADTRQATFLGKVSSESLVDAYNAADFLFFPTKYEGFPVAPMEALACGLPIVVSKESNMGEVVSNGTQGFVVDDGCYSDKIACLVEDSEFRGKMSLNCRDLALHYSWSSQASKYYELYRKVVGA
jgi:glycosyltransferase involved in cell wall biosynthesis